MFRTLCLGPGSRSSRMHANSGGRLIQQTRAPRHKIQKTGRKTMTGRRKPQMRTLLFFLQPSIKVKVKLLSHVQLFAIPWTVAYQALLSMEFSRQEHWGRLPFPSPGESSRPRD